MKKPNKYNLFHLTAELLQVAYVRDAASARTHLASDLAVFRASHRGPMLALLVTPTAAATAALRRAAPALRAMPCCAAPPPAAADIAAAFSESDGVPWQESAPRAALVVAAEAPAWLQERADLARYAGGFLFFSTTFRMQ